MRRSILYLLSQTVGGFINLHMYLDGGEKKKDKLIDQTNKPVYILDQDHHNTDC